MTEQEVSHIEYWVMGFNHGINQERERIIKLLENMAESTFPGDLWHINPFDYAIALIKGENK